MPPVRAGRILMCDKCPALEAEIARLRAIAAINRDTVEAQQRVYNAHISRMENEVLNLRGGIDKIRARARGRNR